MQEGKEVESVAETEAYSNQTSSSFEFNEKRPEKSDSAKFYAYHTNDLITESSNTGDISKEYNPNILPDAIKIKKDHKWHSWKISDASIDSLSENLKTNFPKFYRSEIDTLLDSAVADETLEIVCLISAYLINNYFGSPSQKCVDESELVSYLYRLTPLGTNKIKENFEKAKSIRAPEFMLHVDIIEACNVQHNPSNKSGYPFCKLWMNSNSHHSEWTEKGNDHNNPVWNAQFYMNVRYPKKDFLCIEVWDTSEMETIESEERCALCSKIFCCGCGLKPFPIGRVDIKVKDLFIDGTDEWFSIKSRKRKVERGKLRVKAYFGIVAAKTKTSAFKRHMLLLKVCVQEGLNQVMERESTVEDLDEILEPTGQTLIHLHRVMSSLTACENSVSKFVVVNRIRTANDSIQLKIMYQLLTETCDCLNQDCLADAVEIQLKDLYTKEVQILHDRCFNFLNSLHSFDLANDPVKLNEFKYSLKCIHICEEVLLIESAPLKTLKMEALDWIESEEETLNELEPHLKLEYLIELLGNLTSFHKAADSVIEKLIPHETYTNITFHSLVDFCDAVKTVVVSFSMSFLSPEDSDNAEKGIQLYSQIKCFAEYILNKAKTHRSHWEMSEFQSWFNDILIEGWFKRRKETAVQLMKNAVTDGFQKKLYNNELLMDNIIEVLMNILDKHMTSLWLLLSHPESITFDSLYLNAIHEYCLQYYETARDLIESQYLSQKIVRQYVLDLCILANNLWELSREVKTIMTNIGETPSVSIETGIVLKFFCQTVCKDVSHLLIHELEEPLNQIVMAETLEHQGMAIDAYQKYCVNLIQDSLSPNMEKEVYTILKQKLWARILDFVNSYLEKFKEEIKIKEENDEEKTEEAEKKDIFFRGLFKILTLSKHFCFTDEKDELLDFVENESYTKLVEEIGKYLSQYQ